MHFIMGRNVINCCLVITLLCLNTIQNCMCDVCTTCLCSDTGTPTSINCHERLLDANDKLQLDLLILNEYRMVKELILSKNNIKQISINILKRLDKLEKLDLSENLIDTIRDELFINLKSLKELNISHNQLTTFNDVSKIISTLNALDLSYNRIHTLERTKNDILIHLKFLDLSHNEIINVDNEFLKSFSYLQYLDLSFNNISFLTEETLSYLPHLKVFHINNNNITSLRFNKVPQFFNKLHCGYNRITKIPYELNQIQILNIEFNSISHIDENLTSFKYLEHLNISGNILSDFPNVTLKELKILDISNNNFSYVPKYLSVENFPLLSVLRISKNPIQNLNFNSKLRLRSFTANYIDQLETIDRGTFSNLEAHESDCINLTLSNNRKLSLIDEKSFDHMRICFMDISDNRISYIASELILLQNNLKMSKGIDLQGNPFNCTCSLQWMLDNLIPKLYSINPNMLNNLRCSMPSHLANKRMVHWYKWKNQVFCNDVSNLALFNENLVVEVAGVSNQKVMFDTSPGLLAVVGTAMVVLIMLVVVGIILTQRLARRRTRINRRF